MSAAWMLTDDVLQQQLQAYIDSIAGFGTGSINLFKNDHVPVAGDDSADYTPADFAGYTQSNLSFSSFGSVTVTSHVAKSVNSVTNTFTASSGASPQIVYGYYVENEDSDLMWAERFESPITVNPNDAVNITPELRHTIDPD